MVTWYHDWPQYSSQADKFLTNTSVTDPTVTLKPPISQEMSLFLGLEGGLLSSLLA